MFEMPFHVDFNFKSQIYKCFICEALTKMRSYQCQFVGHVDFEGVTTTKRTKSRNLPTLAAGVMHNIEPAHHALQQEVDWKGRRITTAHHKVG